MPTSYAIHPEMTLTVFIPDFARGHGAAGRPRLPALERMCARGRKLGPGGPAEFLAPLFGLEPQQLVPGPFMRLGDGGSPDEACWFSAGFVHLAPDRDQLVLMPESILHVTRAETAALAGAFDAMYGAEGWALEVRDQGRAYLRCPQPLDAVTHDPETIAGQPVLERMAAGADAVKLKQLMNEIQMLFHTHAVNTAREEAGQPTINSLWLWGGGVLPKTGAARTPKAVMSNLPLLQGLARWAGGEAAVPSVDAIGPDCLVGLAADDVSSLERDWFAPLFTRLKSGKVQQLSLCLGGLGIFELNPNVARRFWRRTHPLVAP
jgi:hypothetical protein